MKPRLRTILTLVGIFLVASATYASAQTPSPPGAKVYFINLKDGAEVDSPFLVQFGLSGMGVAPAGVEKPNTGHHHLIIDTTLTPDELKQPIPAMITTCISERDRPKRWSPCQKASTRCNSYLATGCIFRMCHR
jgi:Domain of unknown function (DUF4399)